MPDSYKVVLKDIINELHLKSIYLPKAAEEIEICENEVTRPGAQLMGFYEYFVPERTQVFGNT